MTAAAALSAGIEHRCCELCRTPINDQGLSLEPDDGVHSRGWIHTLTDQYRCPPGMGFTEPGRGLAFAFPDTNEDALEMARDEAYQVGYETAQEALHDDEQLEEAKEAADAEGARAMFDKIQEVLTEAVNTMQSGTRRSPRGLTVDQLLEALDEAWEGIERP